VPSSCPAIEPLFGLCELMIILTEAERTDSCQPSLGRLLTFGALTMDRSSDDRPQRELSHAADARFRESRSRITTFRGTQGSPHPDDPLQGDMANGPGRTTVVDSDFGRAPSDTETDSRLHGTPVTDRVQSNDAEKSLLRCRRRCQPLPWHSQRLWSWAM
jgi:hypothetical protein